MSLPKIEHPRFELEVPSTKQKIKFRPFVMREYKALLQAVEMRNGTAIVNTIADIIKDCTFGELDITKLKIYDIDYIFLAIRSKSIGQRIPIVYTCAHCNEEVEGFVDLGKVKIEYPENYKEEVIVKVSDTSGIVLQAPQFSLWRQNVERMYDGEGDNADNVYDAFILSAVKSVYDGDEVKLLGVDFTDKELLEWIGSQSVEVNNEVEAFFNTGNPRCILEVEAKCQKCDKDNKFTLGSLEDFFV